MEVQFTKLTDISEKAASSRVNVLSAETFLNAGHQELVDALQQLCVRLSKQHTNHSARLKPEAREQKDQAASSSPWLISRAYLVASAH